MPAFIDTLPVLHGDGEAGGPIGREGYPHFVDKAHVFQVHRQGAPRPEATFATVIAEHHLQEAADYRGALQDWFSIVEEGGHLVVSVPHAFLFERQHALPARWDPGQRRLYTPRSLLDEVEEALVPNSYRVRALYDDDAGYDYARPLDGEPVGRSAIVLVLQKIAPPAWALGVPAKPVADAPDYAFEAPRTRVEMVRRQSRTRILIMKLDHLGDLIMSLPALERARQVFADAHITLLMGSWNVDMARSLGLADEVIAFDVFPRNSTEEEVDVHGKAGLFQKLPLGEYDLAIDLRSDPDTRFLLRYVKARLRAGIGTRSQFPFLDIFLPMNQHRNETEAAREELLPVDRFAWQGSARKHPYRVTSRPTRVERDCAIVWGPYFRLRTGNYIFDPHIELEGAEAGLLLLDVALDTKRVASAIVSRDTDPMRLAFAVTEPDMQFEFRIWAVDGAPSRAFSFFGGRLIRQGGSSVLHQSEYQLLLIQLIVERVDRYGLLEEVTTA